MSLGPRALKYESFEGKGRGVGLVGLMAVRLKVKILLTVGSRLYFGAERGLGGRHHCSGLSPPGSTISPRGSL